MRAPTPSAAAEIAVPDRSELKKRIQFLRHAIESATTEGLEQRHDKLQYAFGKIKAPDLSRHRQRIDDIFRTTSRQAAGAITLMRSQLNSYSSQLSSLNPLGTLRRGYAIIQKAPAGKIITRTNDVRTGDRIVMQLSDGHIKGKVTGNNSDGQQGTLI
jgi:exodeoxyribonuclease VII large subunit